MNAQRTCPRGRPPILHLTLLGVGFAACAQGDAGASATANAVTFDPDAEVAAAAPVVTDITVSDVIWETSGPRDSGHLEIGRVIDGAFDQHRNAYVLDGALRIVRIFSPTGRLQQTVGTSGRGPGAFINPLAIHHDGSHTLYVLDAENGLVLFDTGHGRIHHTHTVPFKFDAQDFCIINDRLYVFGLANGQVIHEFALSESLIDSRANSFGELFGPPDNVVQGPLSLHGRIACFPEQQIVVIMSRLLPEIRAYESTSRELLWTSMAPNFVPTVITTGGAGDWYTMSTPRGGASENLVLTYLNSSMLLAQSQRSREGTPVVTVNTCALVVRNGHCAFDSQYLPLLRALTGDMAIATPSDDPLSSVRLLQLSYKTKPN